MPLPQHASDLSARHRAATEDNAGPSTRTLHAVQGLLTTSRATVQAQPPRCAARHQDHGERSALDVVAGRAMSDFLSFVQSPDPNDPITACTDTRQISCIATACRFDAAILVQKPAFLKLIVSALAPSKDATFPPMRAAGTCRNALLVLDRLQSLATLVLKQNRRSEYVRPTNFAVRQCPVPESYCDGAIMQRVSCVKIDRRA